MLLRGLDQLATKEEIQEAFGQVMGSDQDIRVGPLRPYRQNTQAVTVTLPRSKARQMVQQGQLRVGPTCCTIEKRLEIKKCQKCWGFDHSARECKGPDRSKLCWSCGKEGHLGKSCKEKNNYCVLCKEDHALGSGRCTAFRSALQKARTRQNNTNRGWAPDTENRKKREAFPHLKESRQPLK